MSEGNRRTSPMKVGPGAHFQMAPGAYFQMASIYREYAEMCADKRYLTDQDKERICKLLSDAADDYEITGKEIQMGDKSKS